MLNFTKCFIHHKCIITVNFRPSSIPLTSLFKVSFHLLEVNVQLCNPWSLRFINNPLSGFNLPHLPNNCKSALKIYNTCTTSKQLKDQTFLFLLDVLDVGNDGPVIAIACRKSDVSSVNGKYISTGFVVSDEYVK